MINMLIVATVTGIIGILMGRYSVRTKTLTDVMKVNKYRTKKQQLQDAVMQLKNEIADSGAIQILDFEDDTIGVSIRVVV